MKNVSKILALTILLFVTILMGIAAAAPAKPVVTPNPLTTQEVKAFTINAQNVQFALAFPHPLQTVNDLMKGYFNQDFTNKFVKTRMFAEKDQYGNVFYYVPGSDNMDLYVPDFSWDKRTKITFTPDKKYFTVSEYVPAGENEMTSWKAYTKYLYFVKTPDGYRIFNIVYK